MRISSDDIPDEEYEYAGLGGDTVLCLEDGVSRTFTTEDFDVVTGSIQLLTAIPQGCHTFSLATAGLDFEQYTDVYCLPTLSGVSIGEKFLLFFFLLFLWSLICMFFS